MQRIRQGTHVASLSGTVVDPSLCLLERVRRRDHAKLLWSIIATLFGSKPSSQLLPSQRLFFLVGLVLDLANTPRTRQQLRCILWTTHQQDHQSRSAGLEYPSTLQIIP